MDLQEFKYLRENLDTNGLQGNDCSLVNIFLYAEKYHISTKIVKNTFCRKYLGQGINYGYAFPIPFKNAPKDFLPQVLEDLLTENDNFAGINFTYLTENQKNQLDDCIKNFYPEYKINWQVCQNYRDYLYLQENLASLAGSQLQKKRNHVNKFKKTFAGRWEFKTYPELATPGTPDAHAAIGTPATTSRTHAVPSQSATPGTSDATPGTSAILSDIFTVEEKWFAEHFADPEKNFDLENLTSEKNLIKIALENAEIFGIKAGLLYIDGKPEAMTIASEISPDTIDIHFEKATSKPAELGAYAAINYFFAQTLSSYKYINREEDLGIEGLRKAKLSYKPAIILDKYFGQIVKK